MDIFANHSRVSKLSIELSPLVKESRYLSLTRRPRAPGVFFAGFEVCAPDYLIDRQSFPFWILEYIDEGEGEVRVRGKKHLLRSGSVICYGPGIPIHFYNHAERPFHKYFFCRNDTAFPERWRQVGLSPGSARTLATPATQGDMLDQLIHEGVHGYVEKSTVLSALELIITTGIRRDSQQALTPKDGPAQVYDLVMQVLHENFSEINSLAELADRTGYGAEYLCRVFKRYHNESPYQTLLRMKMNEAFRLLKEGRLRVMDIAEQVGFQDPLHFSRVFRKVMGMAPSTVSA